MYIKPESTQLLFFTTAQVLFALQESKKPKNCQKKCEGKLSTNHAKMLGWQLVGVAGGGKGLGLNGGESEFDVLGARRIAGSIISPSREKAPLLSSTPMQSPQARHILGRNPQIPHWSGVHG